MSQLPSLSHQSAEKKSSKRIKQCHLPANIPDLYIYPCIHVLLDNTWHHLDALTCMSSTQFSRDVSSCTLFTFLHRLPEVDWITKFRQYSVACSRVIPLGVGQPISCSIKFIHSYQNQEKRAIASMFLAPHVICIQYQLTPLANIYEHNNQV